MAITFGDETQINVFCPHQHPITVVAKFDLETLLLNLLHGICEDCIVQQHKHSSKNENRRISLLSRAKGTMMRTSLGSGLIEDNPQLHFQDSWLS